ncbi:hypothetical protein HF086_003924 [Spodoptera exigua]|uniref:Uncharacterized protein n=1 Tax=Spodoptera exigua TaxID=7107 RepID=A0A922MAF3_SPOEX|nr:hypothetical protein HF086_003924 [Spodoptera exigua]
MKNVIVGQHYERFRKKSYNKFNKVFTEADIRSFIREHLFDFFNEYSLRTYAHVLVALENELVDVIINAIDCIRCGHIEDARDEMNIIFQELANLTENQAKYVASVMLRDLQQVLNHCNFNHTYMILNMNNNSGPSNRGHFNENIERLNSDDFRENLDRYANQLCQQINQWLDNLNIPQIQDTGIREVVVNDLAADIIDRLKYLELNQINTADEDELEALKYQIFKWINKLVGDDNQETINNARILLDKIRSVPIPLLIHPRAPQYTLVECPNPECYQDPMRPCLGEFGPGTCSEINRKLRPPTPCCTRAGEEVPCPAEQCCIRETCPEILESQGLVKSQNKSYSTNQDYYRRSPKPQTQSQPLQQPQSSSSGYQSSQDQSSASDKYYTVPDSLQSQEKQLPHSQDQSFGLDPQKPQTFPSSYQSPQSPASVQDKYFASPSSPQNQVKQLPYNQDQSFSLGQQQPQTFPSSYQSQSQASAKDKYSASPDNQKIRERTPAYNRDKSFGLGQTYGPSNKKWTSNTGSKSNAHGPMQSKRPLVNEDIQQSMFDVGGPSGITNSPQGAQTSISIVPGPARPTPHPSIKKILADYDAYLKEWVKKVSIPMNTPSEKQAADKARLDLYNGVYKTITKMKLDPKIFGNPLYFKELFNEEIEKLIKNLPKSKQLEIEKPALSAELLKKTLEMNNLIRSLNVSSTYKQHVIDCVENNSPRAPPLANETDQQNEEIEKHNVADYYILHRRYKDEDNVKANFHKKNFLKSLDDYLENIKKRHDLIGIETYGYA